MDISSNERQPSLFLLHNYAADKSQGRSYNSKRTRSPTGVSPYQPSKYLSLEDTKIKRTVPRWSEEEKKWLQTFVNQNENERQQMTPDTFWNFVSNKFTENFQNSRTGSSCKKTYQRLFFNDGIQMHSNKTTGTQTDSSCIASTSCELDQSSSIDNKNKIISAIVNDDIDTVVDLIYKNPTLKALLWTKYTSDIELTVEANKTIQPIAFTPEDKPDVQKSSRRSLIFSDENHLIGEIQVIIHHPSGKRVKSITSETYKTVCRSIVRDADNTDKTIIESLVASNPKEVVNGCSKIIEKECQQISKAALDTLLRKKNHDDFFDFNWEHLHTELNKFCPGLLYILKTASGKKTTDVSSKYMRHVFLSAALLLHGRNQEINFLQFVIGFILSCGGCTLRTIERLCNMGLSVHPVTIHKKLESWQDNLDSHVQSMKTVWENGNSGITKYQLVGDNWDRNILPSYRTSQQKTLSLHLFNLIAVEDRFTPNVDENVMINVKQPEDIKLTTFIPSVQEQAKLMEEFTFLYATSLIENHPQLNASMKNIYPAHLHHPYSHCAGIKTSQYPLGLFDCNETKTQEVIQLLKQLTNKYVPVKDGELIESVFFGGDRLTDERVQCAQAAMANSTSAKDRLEGFISKIEDFHRLMNFLEIFSMV